MSLVKINKVNILNNPAKFTDDLELEVTFDVVENLEDGNVIFFFFVFALLITDNNII